MEMKLIARQAGYIERDVNKVDDNLIAYYTDTHFVPFTEWNTDLIARACKVYCVKYPIR